MGKMRRAHCLTISDGSSLPERLRRLGLVVTGRPGIGRRPVIGVRHGACTEDGLTDTHHGRPFFDGDFEIAGHAHGQFLQPDTDRGVLAQALA